MPSPLADIRLLAFDVDGVVTDGRIWFDEEGREMHAFHVHDGMGMVRAAKTGLLLAAISGRPAPGVRARLTQLRVSEIHLGVRDKWSKLQEILAKHQISAGQCCFVGDDINDLEVMAQVGLSYAPADAHPSAQQAAQQLTHAHAGQGVLREIIDAILAARGEQL